MYSNWASHTGMTYRMKVKQYKNAQKPALCGREIYPTVLYIHTWEGQVTACKRSWWPFRGCEGSGWNGIVGSKALAPKTENFPTMSTYKLVATL